jgi:hypothetical protein
VAAVITAFALMTIGAIAAQADIVPLKISDHGTQCMLVNNGTAVECIGKYSGLGSTTTNINVSAPFTCRNKAGNVVVGQSTGASGPIQPQNGQVSFDVTTSSVTDKCTGADGHTATFSNATITIEQNGQTVATFTYPIT